MMNWWLDKGVDGFRMDVMSLISKEPGLPRSGAPGLNGYASLQRLLPTVPGSMNIFRKCAGKVLDRPRHDSLWGNVLCSHPGGGQKICFRSDGREVNMVFQFEHMDVDSDGENKWTDKKLRSARTERQSLPAGKKDWMRHRPGTACSGKITISPGPSAAIGRRRPISGALPRKCWPPVFTMMQGTPYIYQGEELGMTNAPFQSISDFRDLDSINAYRGSRDRTRSVFTEEEMLSPPAERKAGDNARTPFQWE